MRRLIATVALIVMYIVTNAQFINDGATITIQSGATLRIESDFQNNGTGTLTNNGTLEVSGNFTNAGTATISNSGTIKFFGSSPSQLTSGGDVIANLDVSKDGSTVSLMDATSIGNNLSFNSTGLSKLVLGANNLILGVSATTSGADNNEYIVADGSGKVFKQYNNGALSSSNYQFEIGDASNYTPINTSVTGTASSNNSVAINLVNSVQPNIANELPSATNFLTRYWNVDATNISPYSNMMTGTYINNTEDLASGMSASALVGASRGIVANSWQFAGSTGSAPSITGTTTSTSTYFTGVDLHSKFNIIAFLQGPTSSGGVMTTYLQNYFGGNSGLLPNNSPYGSPVSVYNDINNPGGIVGQVVDWVLIQTRSASNPATIIDSRSMLLKPDGTIVNSENGSPFIKGIGNSYIVLHHRNHLAVMSNSIALNGSDVSYNFANNLSQAYNNGSPVQMIQVGGKWTMISGDPARDLFVDGLDLTSTYNGFDSGLSEVYTSTDLNLDGFVDGIDLVLQKLAFDAGYYSELGNY